MPSSTSTIYKPRFLGQELVERSTQPTRLRLRIYRDGQIVAGTSGTITIYDRSGAAVVSDGTITASSETETAYYDLADTSARPLEDGWTFLWKVVLPDGEQHSFPIDGALVRWRGVCPVVSQDVWDTLESLKASSAAPMTRRTDWTPKIEQAWHLFQDELTQRGRRPWLILSNSATRKPVLYMAIQLALEDLAMRGNPTLLELAKIYGGRYDAAMGGLTLRYDKDQDAKVDDVDKRDGAQHGLVWFTGHGDLH